MFIETLDRLNLHVTHSGKGMKCLYIHGGPGAWSKDFEVFFGDYLSETLSMYYLDQRGCGRSEGDKESDYSIDAIINDIECIRKKLDIEEFIIIAHSFGGVIATAYTRKYSKYVKALILINCTLNMEEALKSQIKQGCKILAIDNIEYSRNLKENWRNIAFKLVENDLYYKLQYADYNNYIKVKNIDKDMLNTSMSEQSFSNDSYFYDYTSLSEYIDTPTLIIIGEYDFAIGPDHYKSFKFKNSIVRNIKGVHNPYIENPIELEAIIKDFILSL